MADAAYERLMNVEKALRGVVEMVAKFERGPESEDAFDSLEAVLRERDITMAVAQRVLDGAAYEVAHAEVSVEVDAALALEREAAAERLAAAVAIAASPASADPAPEPALHVGSGTVVAGSLVGGLPSTGAGARRPGYTDGGSA